MPFTEKAKMVVFDTYKGIPYVSFKLEDDTTQIWYWDNQICDWNRDDKGKIKL